jgi:hypothetical protein
LGRDINVYSANRWSVGILILVAGGIGICLLVFYPLVDAYIRSVQLRRTFGFMRFVSPEIAIWSMRAIAIAFLGVALAFTRMVINPRMVSVDGNGIEVRHLFSTQRGRWRDFVAMKAIGRKGLGTIRLSFKKVPGTQPTVTLPPRIFGLKLEALLTDMSVYIMEPKKVAEGSLDKYDPKKLAKKAAATEVPIEMVMQEAPGLEAEDAQPILETVAARRAFGKRNAA